MKRFSVISLLALTTLQALACAWPDTHNYYLFSVYSRQDNFADRSRQQCLDNWSSYLGEPCRWFDAEAVAAAARRKGDALMASYVGQLERYLRCAEEAQQERWNYPTRQQLADRRTTLLAVRQYAQSKLRTRLRSQHALLFMRCNMMLGRHKENVAFWEQTASKYIETVYRDMMHNIYAGALLKTGRCDEATAIFAGQNDTESLYTYFYKTRTLAGIRSEYQRDPNAPTLPFLLQDFANNAQETVDALQEFNMPGMLYVHQLKEQECRDMTAFATQVVSEGRTRNPALWQSLKGWLQYLYGNGGEALETLRLAAGMEGTPRIRDNARVLQLFVAASQQPVGRQLDDFLAGELQWLYERAAEERAGQQWYQNHYTEVYDRLVHQVLVPRYDAAGRHDMATAFLAVLDEQPKVYALATRKTADEESSWNYDYSGDYFQRIDTIPVRQLEQYRDFVAARPGDALSRWLSARLRHDDTYLRELIGTKYLRLGEWKKAIAALGQVPQSFVNHLNIAPYMAQRSYTKERWMGRQQIPAGKEAPGSVCPQGNQKLSFAREMLQLENGYSVLSGRQREQRALQLAIRYYQASYDGDAWYLTHYGHSILDSARNGERDFVATAAQLLEVAARSTDPAMTEHALYALAFVTNTPFGNRWFSEDWDTEKGDFVRTPQPAGSAYRALARLADFERSGQAPKSSYVSRCDTYRQFLKQYK